MATLADLEAEFVDWTAHGFRHGEGCGQGVLFDCPCGAPCGKILVWFQNPIHGAPAPPTAQPLPRWRRLGDTLATLSLQPSINVTGHWHGWVIAGEVRDS